MKPKKKNGREGLSSKLGANFIDIITKHCHGFVQLVIEDFEKRNSNFYKTFKKSFKSFNEVLND